MKVCFKCGIENMEVGRYKDGSVSTFHNGTCAICGEITSVTDGRAYGLYSNQSSTPETSYAKLPCDKCGKTPSTRWYGFTNVRLCNNPECDSYFHDKYMDMLLNDEE